MFETSDTTSTAVTSEQDVDPQDVSQQGSTPEVVGDAIRADLTESDKWEAVAARDASFDGSFVYAVRTTGVYCPPSCSSRRPKRENVEFFDAPQQAETAGYRACKRCRNNGRVVTEAAQSKAVAAARMIIDADSEDTPSLDRLSTAVGLSPTHLQRVFKAVFGVSPKKFAEGQRMEKFRSLLRDGADILEAVYGSGHGAPSRVYARTASHLGMNPKTYQRGGAATEIRYGVAEASLGLLLVAVTKVGICCVRLGDTMAELEAILRTEYPAADLLRDDHGLRDWIVPIVRYIDGEGVWPELPIDLRGTAFERAVWEALRQIPCGTTVTYSELAAQLGRPKATRAVANACARNGIAVLVPCHRVVPKAGGTGGYRWGLERKARLLALEAAES